MIFPQILKQLRAERGYSQEEMAKRLHVTRSTYANWEQGSRKPDFETLEEIADFFNADMDYLIGRSQTRNKYKTDYFQTINGLDIPIETHQSNTESQKQLALIFSYMQKILSLNDENKRQIFDYIDFIAGKEKDGESK